MRTHWNSLAPGVALGIVTLLAGPSAAWAQKTAEPPGFLSDYSKLAEDPKEAGSKLIYKNPKYSMDDFDSLHIEDLTFVLYPQDETTELDSTRAAKVYSLEKKFSELMKKELKKRGVRLVEEPAPGVLHCRWAITNLGRSQIAMRLLPQAQEMDAFTISGRHGVAVEGECLDGASGDPVLMEVEVDKGSAGESDFTTWPGAESRILEKAEELAVLLAVVKKGRRKANPE